MRDRCAASGPSISRSSCQTVNTRVDLPPWLLAILACPLCHQELEALPFSLACRACQRTFLFD